MPSIVPSPVAPGINPNFNATVYFRDPYVVPAGTTYYTTSLELMFTRLDYGANGWPILPDAAPFINDGTLWNRCLNNYVGTVLAGQNFGHITNNGLMVSEAPTGQAITIWSYSSLQGLTNSGQILALSTKQGALAIIDYGYGDIVNDGLIAARRDPAVPDGPNDIVYGALTINRNNGGRVVNGASGEILAEGPWAQAMLMGRGHTVAPGQQDHPDIDNAGLIEAVSTLGARPSIGIEFDSLDLERVNILNSGTIRADIAIAMDVFDPSGALQARKIVTNLDSGVIDGALSMSRYDEIVVNHGLIDGSVAMFEGDDLIVNTGRMTGPIDLGSGNDQYLGQAAAAAVSLNGNSGMDLLLGGNAADSIDGGDGDDWIQGGGGADLLIGGAGADRFVIANVNDSTAADADTIRGFQSGVDKIDLSAIAPTSIDLSVSSGVTTLTAQVAGGTVVIHVEGSVTLGDIIQNSPGTVLNGTANAEVLSATGAVHELHGGDGDDLLAGSAGNDLLDGGAGADIMAGGPGDDIYIVDNSNYGVDQNGSVDMTTDRVVELDGEGVDEVRAYVQYVLPDGVENLTFLGAGGIRVDGNGLDNVMVGNAADNIMAGNAGNDVLVGGGGSDILDGGVGADRIVYLSIADSTAAAFDNLYYFESGIDKIDVTALAVTSISWTQHTENTGISLVNYFMATVTTAAGALTIRVTGDHLVLSDFLYTPEPDQRLVGTSGGDTLTGGSGNDTLDGLGGADLMIGKAGNDIYYVDDSGDQVIENSGEGTDEVRTALADYTLPDNVENLTATATAAGQILRGNALDNIVTGSGQGDLFRLEQGGNDTANGGGGDDGFFFGAAFTIADHVDGGAGTNDQIALQGNYTLFNRLVMGADTIAGIEALVVLPGFSYDIVMNDGNVVAGGILKVQATQLAAGQSLHFDGTAETDGSFLIFGGNGDDNLTGGAKDDGFYFGPSQFNGADIVNGGDGTNNQLGLDGDYGSLGSPLVLGTNVTNVEVVVLLPGPAGTPNHFNVTTSDAFVASQATETIFGLQTSTGFTFDGSHEHDGAFKVYGGSGADTITGSAGADWIFGGGGADSLAGGAGNDIFYYDNGLQSTLAASDTIGDFATGDKIDLSGIDAIPGGADDMFSFLGAGAFTGHAGELRAFNTGGNNWTVAADLDGDGNADFQLSLVVSDAHPITAADFNL